MFHLQLMILVELFMFAAWTYINDYGSAILKYIQWVEQKIYCVNEWATVWILNTWWEVQNVKSHFFAVFTFYKLKYEACFLGKYRICNLKHNS